MCTRAFGLTSYPLRNCRCSIAIAIAAVASIAVQHRKFETAMKITRLAHTILRSRVESTQNFACQL